MCCTTCQVFPSTIGFDFSVFLLKQLHHCVRDKCSIVPFKSRTLVDVFRQEAANSISTVHEKLFSSFPLFSSPPVASFWTCLFYTSSFCIYTHPIRSYRGCEGRGLTREKKKKTAAQNGKQPCWGVLVQCHAL